MDAAVVTSRLQGSDRFESLFASHYSALARLMYRVVGDAGWAEELAAEAFWKLHRNPPSTDDNLQGWLYRTGLRLALDSVRKRKRRTQYEAMAPLPQPARTPEDAAFQGQQQLRVRQVLAALKPRDAELLVLRSEGCKLVEIASIAGVAASSVGTLLARADRAFRKEYVKRYGEQ
jgi:RNA polymerase sigma-70 factor (ECF subfamily)